MNKYINEPMIRIIDAYIFVRRELYWSCVDLDLCEICLDHYRPVGIKWDMYQQG